MEKWTVILRTPDGLHFEVVEADMADWSDDGKHLEFYDMEATKQAVQDLTKMNVEALRGVPPGEATGDLAEILRALGKIRVAQFEREAVIGYFIGLKANVDIDVTPRGGDPL